MSLDGDQSPQVILRTKGVSKNFGKFAALKNVSAEASRLCDSAKPIAPIKPTIPTASAMREGFRG